MSDGFRRYILPDADNLFPALSASVAFEQVGKGRQGTVLVAPDPARGVPIVRTTTPYAAAAHSFAPLHLRLAEEIRGLAALPLAFNNALIERYANSYFRMGFHSDQAQDLQPGSSIALLSCYQHPERATPPRVLVVEPKRAGGDGFELPLIHHSVVVFSLETNRRFRHKIVLDRGRQPPDNHWLGLTLRTSGTFVRRVGDRMCFEDGAPLSLADEAQRRAFFGLRRRENQDLEFRYPRLRYTISPSDLMEPGVSPR